MARRYVPEPPVALPRAAPWPGDLAKRLRAPTFESPGDHLSAPSSDGFTRALLAALRHAGGQVVSSPPSTGTTIPVT
jgi:hypothetical protein